MEKLNQNINNLFWYSIFSLLNELTGLEFHCEFYTWNNALIKRVRDRRQNILYVERMDWETDNRIEYAGYRKLSMPRYQKVYK